MKKEQENKQYLNEDVKDLLFDECENEIDEPIKIGEFVDEDERFEKEPIPKKALDNDFKKKIKKENKRIKLLNQKEMILGGLKGIFKSVKILRTLDFIFNLFSIVAIAAAVIITFKYFIEGNPYMVAVGCLLIFITIYLNEKIN